MSSLTEFDLVIVGGGLVGTSLANLVMQEIPNLHVALIDASKPHSIPESGFDPRVIALSKASEGLFRELGIWESVVAKRACPYFDMHVWDGEGTGEIHFDCHDIHVDNLGHIVENSILLSVLDAKLEGFDQLEVLRNTKVEAIARNEDGSASLTLDNAQTISTPLVVAADGAHSHLRVLSELSVREWDYGHSAIVTTVECESPHQFTAWQRFNVDGPLAFLPLSLDGKDQHHCSIVWSVEHARAENLMALEDKYFAIELASSFESKLGRIITVDKRFKFPLMQRHARRYVAPGLVLVGDAAHTIHPLAGQGANLGFYDVKVLAEEVARAHRRGVPLSDASITSRYERRRQPHNLSAMAAMEGFKRLFGSRNLAIRWLRNEGLRQVGGLPWLKNQLSKIAAGQI